MHRPVIASVSGAAAASRADVVEVVAPHRSRHRRSLDSSVRGVREEVPAASHGDALEVAEVVDSLLSYKRARPNATTQRTMAGPGAGSPVSGARAVVGTGRPEM